MLESFQKLLSDEDGPALIYISFRIGGWRGLILCSGAEAFVQKKSKNGTVRWFLTLWGSGGRAERRSRGLHPTPHLSPPPLQPALRPPCTVTGGGTSLGWRWGRSHRPLAPRSPVLQQQDTARATPRWGPLKCGPRAGSLNLSIQIMASRSQEHQALIIGL